MNGNGQQMTFGQQLSVAAPYSEGVLATDNTRLAAIMMVFGAQFSQCPMEWVDYHASQESFIRNQENPADEKYRPRPQVTFNFQSDTVPAKEITAAFQADYVVLEAEFENILAELSQETQNAIRDAVSRLIVRAAHEALKKREFLVTQIKRMPENAKWDHVTGKSGKCVRMGKCSSAELRAEFLAKL